MKKQFSRRHFIRTATAAIPLAASLPLSGAAAEKSTPSKWPIGCFNRPWTNWGYDKTLEGLAAAGYKLTGLLTTTRADPFIGANATPEYLDSLKKKIAASGIKANMAAIRINNALPLSDAIANARRQLDNAKTLELEFVLSFGVDKPEQYNDYYKVMADAAAYGKERGIRVVMKPHGGGSGASEEILRCMKEINHPNFKIWYDAGNIIHYTGKDPIEELKPIAKYVTGFCAKDCAAQKGDVMIQFGKGKVDFAGVFRELKSAGFNGTIMVECCAIGATAEETTANAKANREFLERTLASI